MNANNKIYLERIVNKEIESDQAKVKAIILNPELEIVEPYKERKDRADKGEKRMKYTYKLPSKYASYINRANGSGKSFELTVEEFERILSCDCSYCGTSNSIVIDRIDSRKGYDIDNVQPLCQDCNFMKGYYFTGSNLEQHLIKVCKHFIKTGRLKNDY